MNDVILRKKELRKELLKIREDIDYQKRVIAEKHIFESFVSLDEYKNAKTILSFYPIKTEVNIIPIIEEAIKKGKEVAFPISDPDNFRLDFRYVKKLDDMVVGTYSIPEPSSESMKCVCDDSCLCIVPGLAFSNNGSRIGYGKGYYDRFLSEFKGVSVGICYKDLIVNNIPLENTDVRVNIVITDKEVFFAHGK